MKYIKKPIPIDAWQCTYENYAKGLPDFIRIELQSKPCRLQFYIDMNNHTITGTCDTLEGTVRIDDGCYIIKGIHDEFYPCAKEIFEESYMEAE